MKYSVAPVAIASERDLGISSLFAAPSGSPAIAISVSYSENKLAAFSSICSSDTIHQAKTREVRILKTIHPPQNETQLVKRIIDYVKSLRKKGCRVKWQKNHGSPFSRLGAPDLFILVTSPAGNTRFFALEVKMPGKNPTRRQEHEMLEWRSAGAASDVVRYVADVEILVEHGTDG